MTIYTFSQLILNWYHHNGRKNLPWQKNKTLYTVWISEIMLQQTSVKFVIPYFKKFIKKFPDITSLQKSNLDEILYLWSGLGYYKRAKNIYQSSKIIKNKYQGIFPSEFNNVLQLPGIGLSTAGAILSLSKNFFYSILDGNVKRILMRYYGISGTLQDRKIEKKLWKIIQSITPIYQTGRFNQAMMDIGSLICLPNKPKCNICPLHVQCVIKKNKQWNLYPLKKNNKKNVTKKTWFIIMQNKNNFWIEKNTSTNIWKNLFCFPSFIKEEQITQWIKTEKRCINEVKKINSFLHRFSHFILHIHPILIVLSEIPQKYIKNKNGLWYNVNLPKHIGLPQPVKKIFDIIKYQNVI